MSASETRVVVTGTSWMGSGIGSIETAIHRLFAEATDEVILSVYAIGPGADLIYNWLEGVLVRGIRVTLVIDQLGKQPQDVADRLQELAIKYLHFRLFDFQGQQHSALHAKVIVVDHRLALIGSSNMSRRGLLTNHELAVIVTGPAAAEAGRALGSLIVSPHVRRVEIA